MHTEFKTKLDESEVIELKAYCLSADYFALEQSIGFPEILYRTSVNYFILRDDTKIHSFCQIQETFKFAHIWYGPVCNDREYIVRSIDEIIAHYRQRGFWYLGVQLYLKTGYDCDFIEYQLNARYRINYAFNNRNTKASIEIDLSNSLEEIFRSFRKGHKSDVRKAISSGIVVDKAENQNLRQGFARIYRKMCHARRLGGHNESEILNIIDYLEGREQGMLLVARTPDGQVIGGAIFVYQGISVRYLLSASDPDKRDMPMTHLVIYRALEMAKNNHFRFFDLWGYNHFAARDDQVYNVNGFKKGFGGYFTFFAKKMNIDLIRGGYNIYTMFEVMKRLRGELVRKN